MACNFEAWHTLNYICALTHWHSYCDSYFCASPVLRVTLQVFQYDGSTSCFTPFLGFFFFFGLVTVVLFVIPLPGFLMFICVKRPPVSLALYNTKQDIGGILTVSVSASVCLSVCLSSRNTSIMQMCSLLVSRTNTVGLGDGILLGDSHLCWSRSL